MDEKLNTIVFTPSALMELLVSIDELKDKDIGLTETIDNKLQLQIGESIYELESKDEESVDVPQDVVEQIDTINEESYEELANDIDDVEITPEEIEGGIIKEMAKSLLLGGMLRLTGKLLK